MKNNIRLLFLIIVLQFISALSYSQGVHFSLSGKVNYVHEAESVFPSEYNSYRLTSINDSLYLRENFHITVSELKRYTPKIGYEGGINLYLRDAKTISVRTGLAVNYTSFLMDSEFGQYASTSLGFDTVKISTTGGGNILYVPCDSYTNLYSDFLPLQEGTKQEIYSLKIPLEIAFQVVPGILSIQAGGYLQTPLFSSRKREYISSTSEMINGKKICTFHKVIENDNSGNGLNNFQAGISASLAYRLFRNINLELGITRDMKSIFVKDEYQEYSLQHSDYSPLKLSVGLEYHFGYHLPVTGISDR